MRANIIIRPYTQTLSILESMFACPAIGIDLGTTSSCVGVFQNGNVEIIPNAQGCRKTPSLVAFTDKEHLVGDAAKIQAVVNPTNTVYDVKRLIGCRFDDEVVQGDRQHWPFKVIESNKKPKVEVKCCGKVKQFTAEEISSMVLLEMKKTAEAYLGEKVTNAVITVPANFNSNQRQATINAGKIAGLNVMRLVSEPMAAALAYGLGKGVHRKRNVLILDLGGGAFDAAIMSIGSENFEMKAVGGDTHLGGCDFDSRLVDYCVRKFRQEHGGIDLATNAKAISRLRRACESAKRTLSLLEHASIEVESLFESIDFAVSISRRRFEELCSHLFDRMLNIIDKTLSDAKLEKTDIHEILVVGGSTRILKVQHLLQDFFVGCKFNKSINPDEAAAYGAALLASYQIDKKPLAMLEVTPLSLNAAVDGGAIKPLIESNTILPTKMTVDLIASFDDQRDVTLRVYEGGYAMTNAIKLLGTFYLLGVPLSPRANPRIGVTFAIGENGILHVSAVDKLSKKQISICVKDTSFLSEEQIEQMINETEKLKRKSEKQRSKMAARNMLEDYVFTIQSEIESDEVRQQISEEQRKSVRTLCENTLSWVDFNHDATKEEYELMRQKVESMYSSTMAVKNFARQQRFRRQDRATGIRTASRSSGPETRSHKTPKPLNHFMITYL